MSQIIECYRKAKEIKPEMTATQKGIVLFYLTIGDRLSTLFLRIVFAVAKYLLTAIVGLCPTPAVIAKAQDVLDDIETAKQNL